MNRLRINLALTGGCIYCGGLGMIQVDVSDFGITGIFPCQCVDPEPTREFLAPFADYLRRPSIPDGVA